MAVERTTNPYATYGPGDTGESWAEYFRRVAHGAVERELQPNDDEPAESEPDADVHEYRLIESHKDGLGALDDPPSALLAYQKLLIKQGFDIRLGWYRQFAEGGVYGDKAKKAGEKKPDRTLDTVWLTGYKHGRLMKMTYERTNGGKWSCAWRQINLQLVPVSDKEMKGWINDVRTEEASSTETAGEDR